MAKSKKKASMLGIIMGIVVLIACALVITGIFVDEWTETSLGEISLGEISLESYNELYFSDVAFSLSNIDWDDSTSLGQAMVALAYLTAAIAIALAIIYLLKIVINFSLMRIITGIVGMLTLLAGIALIAVTASYCAETSVSPDVLGSLSFDLFTNSIGLGAYLTSIGAMAGGLCAIVGCARK